ncbi:LysR family transcriptional regulator [Saccharobesus litoralis]|nr:LysR family transcriptional regulator [Saccharobesus litoralis]
MHSWDDFRYFLQVVETGSFSQAATKLGVNHSTVSRRIQALETVHGVKLLERTQTGYQMTDAGASVLEMAEKMQQANLAASRILLGQDARLAGEINLTMPHELFDHILAKPLREFTDKYPDIRLNLHVSKGLRNLANREADLAVRFTESPPDYLIGTRITTMQHGFYKHKDLAIEHSTPLIVWQRDKGIPHWASQLKSPQVVMQVDDLQAMYSAVAAGFGLARMPCFMPDIMHNQDIERLPARLPRSNWGIWLLNHVDLRHTARIQVCRQYLQQVLNRHIPLFAGERS